MIWDVLDTGISNAEVNMRTDAELLNRMKATDSPVLHFYQWSYDSATYGYFTQPFQFLEEAEVAKHRLQLAQRPTGGGIVFHMCDLAFSVVIPTSHPDFSLNTQQNYAFVNGAVLEALKPFFGDTNHVQLLLQEREANVCECNHFCFAKPVKFDVVVENRKIAGGAQRRTRNGYLHQGSISITLPSESYLENILKVNSPVLEGIKKESCPLLAGNPSQPQILEAKLLLKELLIKAFECR